MKGELEGALSVPIKKRGAAALYISLGFIDILRDPDLPFFIHSLILSKSHAISFTAFSMFPPAAISPMSLPSGVIS